MSLTKSITINSQDFNNIEKLFFDYLSLTGAHADPSVLETIQSIIDQVID